MKVAENQELTGKGKARRIDLILVLSTSLLYLAATCYHSLRPFWYDELFTLYVSRLKDLSTIWRALCEGADLNPPLFYVTTRFFTSWAVPQELALRLPAILGYLVLCLSLRTFVGRRLGSAWGLAAMMVPMICGSVFYATEARAYGQMLGCVGLAGLAWQAAGSAVGPRKKWWLAVLGMSLSGALLAHCYAVLVLVPFAMAELARWLENRSIDWWAAAAVCLPSLVAFTYLPLMAAASPVAVNNEVFQATWMSIPLFANFMLLWALPSILLSILAIAVFIRKSGQEDQSGTGFRPAEYVLAVGFLLVPLLSMLLAVFVTKIYIRRYGLAAVCGVTILLVAFLWKLSRRRSRGGYVTAGIFAAGLLVSFGLLPAKQKMEALLLQEAMRMESQRPDLPLVISSGLLFLEMDHYAPAALAARMHYLGDERLARQWTGTDMFDKSFPGLRRWFPIRAALDEPAQFLQAHPRFLVYGLVNHPMDWLVAELKQRKWRLQKLESHAERELYLVEAPMPSAEKR